MSQPALTSSDDVKGPSESSASPLHVLVTGYGPFSTYEQNPPWLAVKPLHHMTLHTVDASERPIRITALEVPVTYTDVLALTPSFHARPPVLPEPNDPAFAPFEMPASGFDFILHVGVAGPGPMRVERRGRKVGYDKPDAQGKLCPIVSADALPSGEGQTDSLLRKLVRGLTGPRDAPVRGFGEGYEDFSEELFTEVDSERLIKYLKDTGFSQIVPSTDAGLYLCEFINYCSLAEAQRAASKDGVGQKATPTLFLHCPPINQPLPTEEVTGALEKVVSWVCSQP